jgi:hypothetical protein
MLTNVVEGILYMKLACLLLKTAKKVPSNFYEFDVF